MDDKREWMRHGLATLAYRATRTLEDAPASFAEFDGVGRKPAEILAHMGDLFDWSLSIVEGQERWHNSQPLAWDEEKVRFFSSLQAFDRAFASAELATGVMERLFQGPVADALTHVGQLAMMRRLAGAPTRGENFYVADIAAGRAGSEQPAPVMPFC